MKKIAIIAFFFLFLIIPVAGLAGENNFEKELNNKVTQLIALLSDSFAEEYRPARGIKTLEKGIGETTAVAVVFSLGGFGGGNNGFQYLAVFSYSPPRHYQGFFNGVKKDFEVGPELKLLDFMMIGGSGIRGIEFNQINIKKTKKGLLITIPAEEYSSKDPMCCPSIKSVAQFKITTVPLVMSRLEEINVAKKKKQ
jgi:hypothetical protein